MIVFKDLIDIVNEDELGIVLCHELSHAVLDHVSEKISNAFLTGWFTAPILAIIWAVVPTDTMAVIVSTLFQKLSSIALDLPYSRTLELEADQLGLVIAARTCFDVTAASALWYKFDQHE